MTALMLLVQRGHPDEIKTLLRTGAVLERRIQRGGPRSIISMQRIADR
jgi:hypothetical protein